jgi:hypothetical protein
VVTAGELTAFTRSVVRSVVSLVSFHFVVAPSVNLEVEVCYRLGLNRG